VLDSAEVQLCGCQIFIVIICLLLIIAGVRQYYKQLPYQPLPQKMFENKCTMLIELLSSVDFDQCLVFSNYHLRLITLCTVSGAGGKNVKQTKRTAEDS